MKPGFTVISQKPNNSPLRGKGHHFHKERETSYVKHQGHVGDLFDCEGIVHQAKWLIRRFCNV
jgi:hypothetical protein